MTYAEGKSSGISKAGAVYSASRYLIMGLGFLRNLFLARLFDPNNYGYWVVAMTALTYADQLHLGLRHLGDRDIPSLRSRGEAGAATILSTNIGIGINGLGAFFFIAASLIGYFSETRSGGSALNYVLIGFAGWFDQIVRFFLMLQRAAKEFVATSRNESVFEIGKTATIVLGAFAAGVVGALLGYVVADFLFILFFVARKKTGPWDPGHWRSIHTLLPSALPLAVIAILMIGQMNLDRLVGSFALQKADLGLYGLAFLLVSAPTATAQSIGMVAYPRMNELASAPDGRKSLVELFQKALHAIGLLMAPFIMGVLVVTHILLLTWLRNYRQAELAVEILSVGVLVFSAVSLMIQFLQTLHQNARCMLLLVSGVLTTAVCMYVLMPEPSFVRLALAASTGLALTGIMISVALQSVVLKEFGKSIHLGSMVLLLLGSSGVILAIHVGVNAIVPSQTLGALMAGGMVKCLAFLAAYLATVSFLLKRGALLFSPFQVFEWLTRRSL